MCVVTWVSGTAAGLLHSSRLRRIPRPKHGHSTAPVHASHFPTRFHTFLTPRRRSTRSARCRCARRRSSRRCSASLAPRSTAALTERKAAVAAAAAAAAVEQLWQPLTLQHSSLSKKLSRAACPQKKGYVPLRHGFALVGALETMAYSACHQTEQLNSYPGCLSVSDEYLCTLDRSPAA